MKSNITLNNNTAVTQNSLPEEYLVVRDREHLHVLGRYVQALFMDYLKKPGKVRVMKRTSLVVAFDPGGHPDKGVTVSFKKERVFIEGGIRPVAHIRITGEPALLMMLSRVPAGWPVIRYFMSYEGKDIIKRIRSGELSLKGAFRHPVEVMRFTRIMAPNFS